MTTVSTNAKRNVLVLALTAVPMTGGSVLMVILAGIIGASLAPTPSLATLPISLVIVATAISTVPATWMMARFGRRNGFFFAGVLAAASALLAAYAVTVESFLLFCGGCFGVGAKLAFTQQFRFAAAESVDTQRAGTAISIVLLGSIGGALLGPAIATQSWLETRMLHQGSFLLLAGSYVLALVLLLFYRDTSHRKKTQVSFDQVGGILRRPLFLVAVLAALIGQGTMAFIMTATPLSMHVIGDHSLEQTASVIRGHVIAMYLPALFTGILVDKWGPRIVIFAGVLVNVATLMVGLQGHAYLHYWWALVLLGVGWNFMFVGGTTLLVRQTSPEERFSAQSVNEFLVFGASALASLLAGSVIHWLGWSAVLWACVPGLAVMLLGLAMTARKTNL